MATIPIIRQHHFGHIASTLDTMNVDVGGLLCRHGIPEWQYSAPEDAIPLPHFIKAFEIGSHAVGEERFGILVAEQDGLDRYAGFGEAVNGSLTVYDALRTACRLAAKEATTLRFWLQRTAGGVLFCRKQLLATPDIELALPHLERYTMTVLVAIVRLGAGPTWSPPVAYLSVPEQADVPDWAAFTDTKIHFCTPFSAILVPDHILSLPIEGQSAGYRKAARAAEGRLREMWDERDLVSSLRLLLRSLLKQNGVDVDTVAEITGISTRTLQRRLAEQGTSFSEVLHQTRYQEAVKLLRQSDIAVADVSDCVGYEHPQHFIRAFKHWAGVTPAQYRNCLGESDGKHAASAAAPLRVR